VLVCVEIRYLETTSGCTTVKWEVCKSAIALYYLYLSVINPLKINALKILYKNSVRTSQETHYISATKKSLLMLFRETVDIYCENHTEHTDILWGRIQSFGMLKSVVYIVTTRL
jgi:hypothetical protein